MTEDQGMWFYPLRYGQKLSSNDWVEWHFHSFLTSKMLSHALFNKQRDVAFTAVMLWSECYRQDPAGTLPDDDIELARLAGYGTDVEAWKAVRDQALRGWSRVVIEDGEGRDDPRLGHAFIAPIAERSWRRKAGRQQGRDAAKLNNMKYKVRLKLKDLKRARLAENAGLVTAIARWIDNAGLTVSAENVTAALEDVGHVSTIVPFARPEGGEM